MESNKGQLQKRQQNIKDISIQQADAPQFLFVLKKVEKLSSAVYLVTALINDGEPLKKKIRELSISIVSDIAKSRNYKNKKEDVFLKINDQIAEIMSFIEIGMMAGIISQMNCGILKKEYENLSAIIEKNSQNNIAPSQEIFFGKRFFGEELLPQFDKRHSENELPVDKGHSLPAASDVPPVTPKALRQTVKLFDRAQKERREKLISVLKQSKEPLNIKDISKYVTGYSDKTIQRDLVELTEQGVAQKIGERRWSRYYIGE